MQIKLAFQLEHLNKGGEITEKKQMTIEFDEVACGRKLLAEVKEALQGNDLVKVQSLSEERTKLIEITDAVGVVIARFVREAIENMKVG